MESSISHYNQEQIVKVVNNYLSKTDKNWLGTSQIRLNDTGVCLALSLSRLKQELLQDIDDSSTSWFKDFIKYSTDSQRLARFFEEYNEKKQEYQKAKHEHISVEQLKIIEKELQHFHDINAVIEFAFFLHSNHGTPFEYYPVEQRVNPFILKQAGIMTLSSTSTMLTDKNYNEFFDPNSVNSPFERGGRYLILVPGHAMSVVVSDSGEVELYDPNADASLDTPLLHTQLKDAILKQYHDNNPDGVLIDIYTVGLVKEHSSDSNLSALDYQKKTSEKMGKFSQHIMQKALKMQRLENLLRSPGLRAAYHSHNPLGRELRMHSYQLIQKYANQNHTTIRHVLFELLVPNTPYSIVNQLILVAHSKHYYGIVNELLDSFPAACWHDATILESAVLCQDLGLFQRLCQKSPSGLILTSSTLDEIELLVKSDLVDFGTILMDQMNRRKISLSKGFHISVVSYLIHHGYTHLAKIFAQNANIHLLAEDSMHANELIALLVRHDLEDFFQILAQRQDWIWTDHQITSLVTHGKTAWLRQLFMVNQSLNIPADIDCSEIVKMAILDSESVILHKIPKHARYDSFVMDSKLIDALSNDLISMNIQILEPLFEKKIIHDLLLKDFPHDQSDYSRTPLFDNWRKLLLSLTGIQHVSGAQKLLSHIFYKYYQSKALLELTPFFMMKHVHIRVEDFSFDHHSLVYHAFNDQNWEFLNILLPYVKDISGVDRLALIHQSAHMLSQISLTQEQETILRELFEKAKIQPEELIHGQFNIIQKANEFAKHTVLSMFRDSLTRSEINIEWISGRVQKIQKELITQNPDYHKVQDLLKEMQILNDVWYNYIESSYSQEKYPTELAFLRYWKNCFDQQDIRQMAGDWKNQRDLVLKYKEVLNWPQKKSHGTDQYRRTKDTQTVSQRQNMSGRMRQMWSSFLKLCS